MDKELFTKAVEEVGDAHLHLKQAIADVPDFKEINSLIKTLGLVLEEMREYQEFLERDR